MQLCPFGFNGLGLSLASPRAAMPWVFGLKYHGSSVLALGFMFGKR